MFNHNLWGEIFKAMNNLFLNNNLLIKVLIVIVISILFNVLPCIFTANYPVLGLLFGVLGVLLALRVFYRKFNEDAPLLSIFFNVMVYIINVIVFPLLVGFLTNYLEKAMYPFLKMFNPVFSQQIAENSLVSLSPYFLMSTFSMHFICFFLINRKKVVKLKYQDANTAIKLNQLKTQLSPHFLFNNISVLTSIIEENPVKAVRFSENLSYVYRYLLDKEKEDLVSLNEELEFTKMYVELLSVRFENAFNVDIQMLLNHQNKYVLPLSIQQAVENIIKHNEISVEQPIVAKIFVEKDKIIIINNLNPKIEDANPSGLGLLNLTKRYSYFTDEKLDVIKTENEFRIELPILTVDNK